MKAKITTFILAICAIFTGFGAQNSVTVKSLAELQPLLKKSNQHIVMTPGTYVVTAKDMKSGKYKATAEVVEGKPTTSIILVEGSGNTLDFTGVTIEIETKVASSLPAGSTALEELHILGNDNTVKGLTLVDVGSKSDAPRGGWLNVLIDGANNVVDGIEVRSTGSHPYGYGEVFGKGGKNVIRHRKHSAVLIRGDFNTFKNSRVIHRAYGHFVFMQAAKNPTVEGCYIEGEMVTTDDILKERGSGSAADKVNFMTVYGYTLPKGYTLSTGEDGIRTYDAGQTMINGERIKRGTSNPTARNCTVKHTRGGVAFTLSRGKKIVDNITLIGCQGGFATGTGGVITNCRADIAFAPAFTTAYERCKGIQADITIMPYEGEKFVGNGSRQAMMVAGTDHNITIRRGEGLKEDTKIELCIGGDRCIVTNLDKVEDRKASNITINNETSFPVVLGKQTTGIKGSSKGKVTDNGTGNNVVKN